MNIYDVNLKDINKKINRAFKKYNEIALITANDENVLAVHEQICRFEYEYIQFELEFEKANDYSKMIKNLKEKLKNILSGLFKLINKYNGINFEIYSNLNDMYYEMNEIYKILKKIDL